MFKTNTSLLFLIAFKHRFASSVCFLVVSGYNAREIVLSWSELVKSVGGEPNSAQSL